MKKKLLLLALAALLLFSSCEENEEANGSDADSTTAAFTITNTTATNTTSDTPVATTSMVTTIPEEPSVTVTTSPKDTVPSVPTTTVPSVPGTTESKPPVTSPVVTNPPVTVPQTSVVPPQTSVVPPQTSVAPPKTEEKPETTPPPITEDKPIVLDKGSEKELANLLKKHPIVSAPTGAFASKSLTRLIESASRSFSESKLQLMTANGSLAVSVPFLGEISRQQLALFLLTDGTDYEIGSTITEKKKVTDERQVYKNGWLYNTGTTTENGKVTETDQYKVKMTKEEYEEHVLANASLTMDTVRDLAELFATADHIKAGMMKDGSFVVLAKGYDFEDMIVEIDPDGTMRQYIDLTSFSKMETALVVNAQGDLAEIYVKLPLGVKLEGIPMTVNIELTVTPSIPESVDIQIPEGGENYEERAIDEVYSSKDESILDRLK